VAVLAAGALIAAVLPFSSRAEAEQHAVAERASGPGGSDAAYADPQAIAA
jgi:hypothetical protein